MSLQVGCVTQTERIHHHRYYDPPENESVLDEIKREFGWQKPPPWITEEPLYKRAARGVKDALTGWLPKDESKTALTGEFQSVEEFRRAQKEAIDRLQQQQSEESRPNSQPSEGTGSMVSPGMGETRPEE